MARELTADQLNLLTELIPPNRIDYYKPGQRGRYVLVTRAWQYAESEGLIQSASARALITKGMIATRDQPGYLQTYYITAAGRAYLAARQEGSGDGTV